MNEKGDSSRRRRKLSAILMADVSGFSRMMGADEHRTIDRVKEFHERAGRLVGDYEGRVVDTAGDSVFAEFDSVVNAVDCARRIQAEQAAANDDRPAEDRVETRIGVHLGDVIVEDYRVYGDGVNIAARLEPLAAPGGICISEAVYHQVRSKLDVPVEDLGVRELHNIAHPIRLYRLSPLRAESPRPPAPRASHGTVARSNAGAEELLRVATLVPACVGGFLLLTPLVLFPTAGVLPFAGSILLGVTFGRVWARRSRRSGNVLLALGLAIASGALWTDWSRVTNAIFVLAGLVLAAVGIGIGRGGKTKRPLDFPGA